MKKRLFTIVILLAGLLAVSPINGAVEGNTNINDELNNVDQMYVESRSVELIKVDEDTAINEVQQNEIGIVQDVRNTDVYSTPIEKSVGTQIDKENVDNRNKNTESYSSEKNKSEVAESEQEKNNDVLTKEEALNHISKGNDEFTYSYMGDENDFSVLREKGYEGYVYLPDVNTDMGVFIDKNTKEKYYFHPSGYMDIYE